MSKTSATAMSDHAAAATLQSLVRDPVIDLDVHTRFSEATQDFSREVEAMKRLKAILSFLGVATARWSNLDQTGSGGVSLNRMSLFSYKGTATRIRFGKWQGIVTQAKGVDGEPVTATQLAQRWDRDRFLNSIQPPRRHHPGLARPAAGSVPAPEPEPGPVPEPAPEPPIDGGKLREFLRICCEHRRREDDTIDVPHMRVLLAGMNGTAPGGRLETLIERAEQEGLLVVMDAEQAIYGFEADLLPAVASAVETKAPPLPAPVAAPVPTDLPDDLLSLLAATAPKMRERERLTSHRDGITASLAANARETAAQIEAHAAAMAALATEKADLERRGQEADAEIAKSDQLHRAIETLRALNQ